MQETPDLDELNNNSFQNQTNLQNFHKKRLSVQTPFEDAIFLEDKALSDSNSTPSPTKNEESISNIKDNENQIDQMVDQVDKLNNKTIIKKVFNFSDDSKSSQEVLHLKI
jgi:hypothetical protein